MNGHPTFLSLFAGIGGFDRALETAGFRCVGQVELDPFCTRVLAARFPHAPRWADVREWQGHGHESPPDLLVGGFPCQGASVAGKRLGLADDRTALFWEICRIQRIVQAPWALLENVPGLRSVRFGRDFAVCLAALKELWPVVGWRTLDSRFFHVAQRRERVFIVCGPSEAAVASVLFESEGGGGHPATGGEARADVAHALARGSSRSGTRFDPNGEDFIVTALRHLGSGGPDDNEAQGGHLIVGSLGGGNHGTGRRTEDDPNLVVHPLTAEGADASEDGTGRGTPLILETAHHGANQTGVREGTSYPVSSTQAVLQSSVRRLTPLECERLQAFPDGWTCLCQPIGEYADPEEAAWNCRCPDGPRYRALGNAVTVSVVEWVGRRLMEAYLDQK